MKLGVVTGAFLLASCASSPTDNTAATDRACNVTDCFAERDVRDFQVLGESTLIVFVGQQRCAFQVELRGTLCDLTFANDVFFTKTGETLRDGSGLRVCSNDIQINVEPGVFGGALGSQQPSDRFGNSRPPCQIRSVASLTDDQLIELLVARGAVPPPPPMGAGEIEVGEQQAEQGAEAEAATPETAGATPNQTLPAVSQN